MRSKLFWQMFTLLALFGMGTNARADITYQLNPGSTLTPFYAGEPTSAPWPLTGTFVWEVLPSQGGLQPFQVVQMDLTAGPYSLSADSSPGDDEASDTFSTGGSYFNEILDTTGLLLQQLWTTCLAEGTFTGEFSGPTTISYTDVGMGPVGGGGDWEAFLNFSATAVPEPSCMALAVTPIWLLARRRRLSRLGMIE
jgi:hypothetical protein